jgi:imidazoleglycerol-phosphate dehydratase
MNALLALHVTSRAGHNAHHVAESCFKAVARALRMAAEPDPRAGDAIPSTKGAL